MSPGGKVKSIFSSIGGRVLGHSSSNGTETVPRSDGFHTAKISDALFTRTNAEVDGEECLHDCDSCTMRYPKMFKIDESDQLYGEIKGWNRHLLVATGKTDWVRDVADEKDSVMEAIDKHSGSIAGGRLMVSATNMPVPDEHSHDGPYGQDRPATVLLLPAFKFVDNVKPRHVHYLIEHVVNKAPTNVAPLPGSEQHMNGDSNGNGTADVSAKPNLSDSWIPEAGLPADMLLRDCPYKYLILMCSQATRDARCGQSAPLLRKEFERQLRPLGLYRDMGDERPGGVGVFYISHVGGHKYSANVMIYRRATPARSVEEQISAGVDGVSSNRNGSVIGGKPVENLGEAGQCIWLARVRPEDCENIVRFTVLQGKVVKPDRQLRGGFDRERGVVSW